MTKRDIERYVRQRTGVITPGERERTLDQVMRYRSVVTPLLDILPTEFVPGYFLPPGTFAADTTSATVATSNRTVARYLGQAPYDINSVTLRFNVLTAAATITWAEVGIGTSGTAVKLGTAEDIRMEGYVNVASTFNSIGIKDTEVPVTISRGAHIWALWGSQATTPFNVLRTIGDGLSMGFVQFADSTRPSTMADPTTFAITAATANSAWIGVNW